jgi:hypothetical protein
VEGDIGEVMAAALKAVELDVEHVGQPGERQPVAVFGGLERPIDTRCGQAGADVEVLGYVIRIVVIDELESVNLPVGG